MENKTLENNTAIQIQKPFNEVLEAIVDPVKMSNYFTKTFLACLKAFLEYGINLRKGAFDFMADKS